VGFLLLMCVSSAVVAMDIYTPTIMHLWMTYMAVFGCVPNSKSNKVVFSVTLAESIKLRPSLSAEDGLYDDHDN
jgi:hypothetical protein